MAVPSLGRMLDPEAASQPLHCPTRSFERATVAGPSVLFVPASGGGGSGELIRCQVLARLLAARNASAQIHFIASSRARNALELGFPTILVDRSPTFHTAEVIAAIERLRPDVVLFDNAGRAEQFRAARISGARVVIGISRPTTLRKAFGLRRLWHTDQQWLLQPDWALPPLTPYRRLKARLHPGLDVLRFATIFEPSSDARGRRLREEMGLGTEPFVLFCPGGGGQTIAGTPVGEIFRRAAGQLARRTRHRVIVVLGPNARPESDDDPNVSVYPSLEHARLMTLVREANAVVTGGGDLLVQTIAMRRMTVATAVASDQGERIRRCEALGLTVASNCNPEDLAGTVGGLLVDSARTAALHDRLAASSIRNGLDGAIAVIEGLAAIAAHESLAFSG